MIGFEEGGVHHFLIFFADGSKEVRGLGTAIKFHTDDRCRDWASRYGLGGDDGQCAFQTCRAAVRPLRSALGTLV